MIDSAARGAALSLCVPNRECARAATRIFVWRQSLRVGVRADGTIPPWSARTPTPGSPGRRRPPSRRTRPTPSRSAGSETRAAPACGAGSTSLTGTVLEGCKKPLATWVPLIGLAPFAVPPGACAEARRISRRTARERRRRPFAAVDGHRDRIVLRRPRPGRRDPRRRRGPLRGIRAGAQARAVQAEAVHGGGHRRPQGARRGGLRARRALRRPHQGGARGPRRGRARRSSTTAREPIASPSGRTVSRTSPARRTRGTRSTWRRWSW